MLKRIVMGGLLMGLVGLLVAGGINRTLARSEAATGSGTGGSGAGRAGWDSEAAEERAGRYGQDEQAASPAGDGQAAVVETVELSGTIASSTDDALTVVVSTGETIEVSGRAWSYAQEVGFVAQPGEGVTLTGFYGADGVLEVSELTTTSRGLTVVLRDSGGRPAWAGGRRGQAAGGQRGVSEG